MAALFARSCAQGREGRKVDLGLRGRDLGGRTASRVSPAVVTAAAALAAASAATSSLAPLAPVDVAAKEGVVRTTAAAGGGGPGERRREGAECRCRRAVRRGAGRGVVPPAASAEEYRLQDLPIAPVPTARPRNRHSGGSTSGGRAAMAEGRRGLRPPRNRTSPDGWVQTTGQKKTVPPPGHGWNRATSTNSIASTATELRLQSQPPNKACAAVRCVSIMETLMEVGGGGATQEEVMQGEEEWSLRVKGSGRKGGGEGRGERCREKRKHSKRRRRERGTTPDWIRRVLEVARRGDVEELSRCLGGMDPTLVRNLSDHSGNNLLHMVAGRGHVGALAWLCGVGSDSAPSSSSGAAAIPANGNLLEAALLDENRAGLTPIGVAIKNGRVGVVEWLLRQGEARLVPGSGSVIVSGPAASISRRLWPGMPISEGPGVGEPSPLHLAAKYGQDRLLRWLLRRSGLQCHRPSPAAVIHSSRLSRTLNRSLDSGLNHGSGDWEEKNEDSAIWKDLLLHSPLHRDLELKFGQNRHPSSREVDAPSERYIPGINQRDHRGRTPLHLAAKAGNMSTCRILLSHGADISLKSELGRKASGCALSRGHNALSSWLSLWEAALTLASQLASMTEVLAETQKQNQELRGHFREVLMVGKRLAKERDEMCRELGEAVSSRGVSSPMSEHLLISRLHKAHFSGSLADMEHRLLLAEQWWRQANGRGKSTNTTNQIPSANAASTAANDGKEALQLLLSALVDAESDVGDVVRVEGVGELSSSSSSASCSSATSSTTSFSSSHPSSRASSPSSSCSEGGEREDEEERKLMALSLDAVYSEIEEREETRRRKSCDFGLLLGIGGRTGAVQEAELRQRFHGLSLTSESGNASVLEVIEPREDEVGVTGLGSGYHHSQLKRGSGQTVVVGGRRRGRRGRMIVHGSQKPQSTSSTVPWDVVLHRSVSETTINHGVPLEEEVGEEERGRGLSVSVEDLLGGGGREVQVARREDCTQETTQVQARGMRENNVPSTSATSGPVPGRTRPGGTSNGAVVSGVAEGRTSTASHSSASSSSLSANSRPDILAGTTPRVMTDELALSVVCDVPDVGSESCGEAGVSGGSGISPISVGLLPISNSSGLKKRNFLQKLSAKARWPSTKRKKAASPVGLSPSSYSLTSSPSSGSGSKRSQEISPEDFKETYLSPRITNGSVESSPSNCRESPRLAMTSCPTGDCPDAPTESMLTGTDRGEDTGSRSIPPQTVIAVTPMSPICDRHGSPGSSTGGHRASQVRAELASVAASEDSGIMMVAPPRPSSSASLPSSSSSCYYSAATRAVGAREASMMGGGAVVALEDKLHHGGGHHHHQRTLATYHLKCVGKRIGSAAEPFLTHPEKALESYLGRTRVQQQRQKGLEEISLPHTPPPPRPPPSPSPLSDPPLSPPSMPHLSPILSERGTRHEHVEEPATAVDMVQKVKQRVGMQGLNCDAVDVRSQDIAPLPSQSVEPVDIEDNSQVDVVDGSTDEVSPSHCTKQAKSNEVGTTMTVDRPWYDLSEEEEEEESVRGGGEGGGGSSGLSGLSVVRSSSEEDEDGWRRETAEETCVVHDAIVGDAETEHEGKSAL